MLLRPHRSQTVARFRYDCRGPILNVLILETLGISKGVNRLGVQDVRELGESREDREKILEAGVNPVRAR